MSTADDILAPIPEAERTRLVPLGAASPIVERITGCRPHKSALYRWATRESGKLRCAVMPGVGRMTCAAWLAEFFAALGEARAATPAEKKTARPRSRRGQARKATTTSAASRGRS